MNQNTKHLKVATDMFMAQSQWSLSFLGIVLIVHIVKVVSSLFGDFNVDTYFNSVFVAANIFMFVVGILCITFLPHFVGHGVTRKDYFNGAIIAAIGLSIAIPIITLIVSTLGEFILNLINTITINNPDFAHEIDTDSNIIGNIISSIVQTFVIPPYIDPASNWLLALIIVSINIFIYYMVGWLIGAAFYHQGTISGLGAIIIGLVIIIAKDALLRIILDLPLIDQIAFLDVIPKSIATIIILALIGITIGFIRSFTKKVTVKL